MVKIKMFKVRNRLSMPEEKSDPGKIITIFCIEDTPNCSHSPSKDTVGYKSFYADMVKAIEDVYRVLMHRMIEFAAALRKTLSAFRAGSNKKDRAAERSNGSDILSRTVIVDVDRSADEYGSIRLAMPSDRLMRIA